MLPSEFRGGHEPGLDHDAQALAEQVRGYELDSSTTIHGGPDPETRNEEPPIKNAQEAISEPPTEHVTPLRQVAYFALFVPASIFGVLIRVGLEALMTCKSAYL